jgi:hypothetical protein
MTPLFATSSVLLPAPPIDGPAGVLQALALAAEIRSAGAALFVHELDADGPVR